MDVRAMSGREMIEAIRDGSLPTAPIQTAIGFDLTDAGDGTATFGYTPSPDHRNPLGSVHGGIALTLLDSAMGAAVHTTLDAGQGYGTLETKVNMVRAIKPDGPPLRAEGRVVHRGSRVATAEARLVDADGGLHAHGTSTCMILNAG